MFWRFIWAFIRLAVLLLIVCVLLELVAAFALLLGLID